MEEYNIKTKVVGVDISNETTTYAVVDIRGNILAEESFATSDYPDVNNFVTVLSDKIVMLVEANGGYETIRSIGVSCPSASSVSGCIENAANLPWKGVIPLSAMLRDRIGLAVGLSNDAHISSLGEYTFGSAHGQTDEYIPLVVTVSSQGEVGIRRDTEMDTYGNEESQPQGKSTEVD